MLSYTILCAHDILSGCKVVVDLGGTLEHATVKMHSALNPAYCFVLWESRRDRNWTAVAVVVLHNPATIDIGRRTRREPSRFAESEHSTSDHAQRRVRRRVIREEEELDYNLTLDLLGNGTENMPSFDSAFFQSLPKARVTEQHIGEGDDGVLCCICRDTKLVIGDMYTKIACEHIFHTHCIETWIVAFKGVRCPACNLKVDGSN